MLDKEMNKKKLNLNGGTQRNWTNCCALLKNCVPQQGYTDHA